MVLYKVKSNCSKGVSIVNVLLFITEQFNVQKFKTKTQVNL